MQKVVDDLNENFLSQNKGIIQKVLSTPHYLCFHCRFPGKTLFLYLGRGASHQGVALGKTTVPKHLRVKDRYLEYARKHWRSATLTQIDCDKEDRVLCLKSRTKEGPCRTWFFWRGRDLFFAHAIVKAGKGHLHKSWEGTSFFAEDFFEKMTASFLFKDVGFGKEFSKKGSLNIDHYLETTEIEKGKQAFINKKKKKRLKLKTNLESELLKIEKAFEINGWTEEDLTDVQTIGKGRFKIDFFHTEGHFKKRGLIFQKLKQWKKSKEIIEQRMAELDEASMSEEQELETVSFNRVKIISPIWSYNNQKTEIHSKEHYVQFQYGSFLCFVGRDASENDYLRTKVAKKNDLWIHVDNAKSGHMFVRGGKPSIENFQVLASALVDLCRMTLEDIPLIFTEASNIKGVKGTRGMVTFKKEKRLTVFFDRAWRDKISGVQEVNEASTD